MRTPIVPDTRWGDGFDQEFLYPRRFLFSQGYAFGTTGFRGDPSRDIVDEFNDKFGDSDHQFFGIPRYPWENVGANVILGSFGDWEDRLIFSNPEADLEKLNFTRLKVDYHCT